VEPFTARSNGALSNNEGIVTNPTRLGEKKPRYANAGSSSQIIAAVETAMAADLPACLGLS
jgi:hypothetical protein